MHVTLVIPAKGVSERVKNKNLYRVSGKTLVRMACEKALNCKNVDAVYIDTESEAILQDVSDLFSSGLKVIKRPKEFSNNFIGANEMMIYALHMVEETDLLCQTFSTSPLITSKTIDNCIDSFIDAKSHDSFFTVTPVQEYFWGEDRMPINFDPELLPNSFDLPKMLMETHGLYGIFPEALLGSKARVGKNPMLIEIDKNESLDINDAEDLCLFESIYKGSLK